MEYSLPHSSYESTTPTTFSTKQSEGTLLMNPMTSLYQTTKSSDFTVHCRGKTYPVHKAILRARSQFFEGACRNPFREMQRGWIDLSEDDPEAVKHMITYFYDLDYLPTPRERPAPFSFDTEERPDTPSLSSTPTSPLSPVFPTTPTSATEPRRRRLDLSMIEDPLLAIAAANQPKISPSSRLSKFGVTSPLVGAEEKSFLLAEKQPENPPPRIDTIMRDASTDLSETGVFSHYFDEDSVPEQVTNYVDAHLVAHAKVYAIAEQYGIRDLKVLAKKKYTAQICIHRESPEFASSLPEVYDGTIESDRGLRDLIISTFRRFPELAKKHDIREVVRETPALAWELFKVAWGLPV